MLRVTGLVAALIAVVALGASAFAQTKTPHQFIGGGLESGDVVAIAGTDLTATADSSGEWYIKTSQDVADTVDEHSFHLNGKSAGAEITARGESITEVTLTAMADSMMDDDDAMMDDDDAMMDDDSMANEGDSEMMEETDSMHDDDDKMMDDGEETMMGEDSMDSMPTSGTGGLADTSGVSAGLIGLLVALGAAAIAGFGLRRVRNRA